MTARPDEVVAWQERYRNTDTGDWLAWRECSRFTHESYVASGHNFPEYETRALTDAAALQSANARLAAVEAELGKLRQEMGVVVHRWIHDPKYSLDQCTNDLLQILDSDRAAAGEGDANQGDGE